MAVTALLINEETGVLDSTVILPFKMEDGHICLHLHQLNQVKV